MVRNNVMCFMAESRRYGELGLYLEINGVVRIYINFDMM